MQGALSETGLANTSLDFCSYPDKDADPNKAVLLATVRENEDTAWLGEKFRISIEKYQTQAGDYLFIISSYRPKVAGTLREALEPTLALINCNFASPEKQLRVLGL